MANNEKKIRDRAVNKLRAWIRSRPKDGPGFGELDLMKVWKGLFYCMWMSDKPLIQEELALNISQLVLSFRNEQSAVLFIKTFFKTMEREWHGIDRLRLDKFYLLIRFFVKGTFNFLKKTDWEDRWVMEVSSVFHEEPLNPMSQAVPDGIRFHTVAVYLVELKSVVNDQVSSDVLHKLLDPLFLLAAHSKNKTVTNAVKKSLFEELFPSDTDEADKSEGNLKNKVDFASIADRLFTLASDREILGRNRNQLYDWVKRLRKQTRGECKGGELLQEGEALHGNTVGSKGKTASCETSDITNIEDGMRRKNISRERETKRRKKHVEGEVEQENEAIRKNVAEKERKKKKRKRKIKEQNLNDMSSNEQAVVEEVKDVEPAKKKKKKSQNNEGNKEKRLGDDKSNVEQLVIVNGHGEKTGEPQESTSLANDTAAINGDTTCSPEISDHQKSSNVEKKVLKKATSPNEEPFAKFQKNFTPPAFFRKSLRKTPRTEPQKSKTSHEKNQTPTSVPAKGSRKRVRIEMSKNTAHTTQDYLRTLKQSPEIPFDAQKTPTQGLLKSPPLPRRTPLYVKVKRSTDTQQKQQKQSKSPKRPKAADFF